MYLSLYFQPVHTNVYTIHKQLKSDTRLVDTEQPGSRSAEDNYESIKDLPFFVHISSGQEISNWEESQAHNEIGDPCGR